MKRRKAIVLDANGKHLRHHRDLCAGHAFKGVAWELERTVISLLKEPAKADRNTNKPGIDQDVFGEINEPKGTRKEPRTGKVLGREPKAKRPETEKR